MNLEELTLSNNKLSGAVRLLKTISKQAMCVIKRENLSLHHDPIVTVEIRTSYTVEARTIEVHP